MHLDKSTFAKYFQEIVDDIGKRKATSPAWILIGIGALVGLGIGCLKIRPTSKPILGRCNTGEKIRV